MEKNLYLRNYLPRKKFLSHTASKTTPWNMSRRSTRLASKAKAEAGGDLALAAFIAPAVFQYLGIRSLVRCGLVCKQLRLEVRDEVERRKNRVSVIKIEVKRLMGVPSAQRTRYDRRCIVQTYEHVDDDGGSISSDEVQSAPTRADVIAARKLAKEAERLIDDEINFHDKFWNGVGKGWKWVDYAKRENDFFREQRKMFLMGPEHIRSIEESNERESNIHEWYDGEREWLDDDFYVQGSLVILPDCFYFPPDGEWIAPSDRECEMVAKTYEYISDNLVENNEDIRSGWVIATIQTAASVLAEWGTIDAFRPAARELFVRRPLSLNILTSVLEEADEFSSQQSGDRRPLFNGYG